MALSSEDKKDVGKHMGKALANKVSDVTKDRVATGIGYKNPRMVNGKLKGTAYEYPIKDHKHLDIVRKAGGKVKD